MEEIAKRATPKNKLLGVLKERLKNSKGKPGDRKGLLWTQLGVLVSVIPILSGMVTYFFFGPPYVHGKWTAHAPGYENPAISGCIRLNQQRLSPSVFGYYFDEGEDREYDLTQEPPNMLGTFQNNMLSFEYLVFHNSYDGGKLPNTYGNGTLILTDQSTLTGFWRDIVRPEQVNEGPAPSHSWTLSRGCS